ncbi:hypothetical protein [Aureliella helgolandensis]|uniref:Uncharacterized protein n=1 Tax=Aureliella helgolandensis TaxID=2527968 RepID=A0A518FZL8_9BACT|nr:hypothetical protein [Aureliella helgolandensis]QDV21807.1 hypothetical protein Q31a_00860 [Aureliella helgolandensis]
MTSHRTPYGVLRLVVAFLLGNREICQWRWTWDDFGKAAIEPSQPLGGIPTPDQTITPKR